MYLFYIPFYFLFYFNIEKNKGRWQKLIRKGKSERSKDGNKIENDIKNWKRKKRKMNKISLRYGQNENSKIQIERRRKVKDEISGRGQ